MDSFSEWATVVAAGATAAATIVLAWLTFVLARATNKLAAATSEPFVTMTFEPSSASPTAFDQVVRNSGGKPAFDVEIEISPSIDELVASKRKKWIWTQVPVLPAGREVSAGAAMSTDLAGKDISVRVSWTSSPGSSEREHIEYTWSLPADALGPWDVKGLHHIGEELTAIREGVEAMSANNSPGAPR